MDLCVKHLLRRLSDFRLRRDSNRTRGHDVPYQHLLEQRFPLDRIAGFGFGRENVGAGDDSDHMAASIVYGILMVYRLDISLHQVADSHDSSTNDVTSLPT